MRYFAYHFEVTPVQPGSEILTAILGDLGFESFVGNDNGFTAYINEKDHAEIDLRDYQFDDFSYTVKVEEMPDINWNAEWEKNFAPVIIDDLLCIRAPFHDHNENVKYQMLIMPKMSFGTGHHQTTRLMCRQMARLNLTGKRLLDMGCGTGVLAIFAKMLGAREIVAIDIDPWSVENSIENCRSNGAEEIVVLKGGDEMLTLQQPFDVILANINKNILKAQMALYSQKLFPGGSLLISGFFVTDVEELKTSARESGLEPQLFEQEEEWAVMKITKP